MRKVVIKNNVKNEVKALGNKETSRKFFKNTDEYISIRIRVWIIFWENYIFF